MGKLFRRILYLLRQRRHERELADEMDFHRSMLDGRSPGEGGFGNATLAREDARGVWMIGWIESVAQDLRYAARCLRRDKAFTLVSLVALGIAIGANTSLFTTFNGMMWRPWPVHEPARVVTVMDRSGQPSLTLAEHEYLATHARTVTGLIASRCIDGVVDGCAVRLDEAPLEAEFVTPGYFEVLGVGMARGHGFPAGAGSQPVAVLSDGAWRARFGRDPAIVGREMRLDDVAFTIVGVASPGFTGTQIQGKDLFIPIAAIPLLRPDIVIDDARRTARVSGRLAAGVSREQAQAELDILSRQYRTAARREGGGVMLMETSFFANQGRRVAAGSVLALMVLAVLLVLALACANVGNLLLARGAARRREMAVRLAIGASRSRIVRQLITESLMLSTLASALGLALAFWLPKVLLAQLTGPLSFNLEPDGRVLLCALGLAVASCCGFGLAPALQISRVPVANALKGRLFAAASGIPLRSILLAAQVAIAMVLVLNAGLIVRGVQSAADASPGFDMTDVSVVSFELPASYETARRRAFARQMLADAPPLMAGHASGFADIVPFGTGGRMWAQIAGAKGQDDAVVALETSSGYFETLGIPIVLGRNFLPGDAFEKAAIVNESMARELWPSGSPIGQTIVSTGTTHRVVGVAKDVRHYAFAIRATLPTMYTPIEGRTVPQLLVRHLDAASAQSLRGLALRLEPRTRVSIAPLAANLDARLATSRVGAWLASSVGALALILATLGVFSVVAYTVEQRTAEVGIRMALGARPGQVIGAILSGNGRALAAGLVTGLATSAVTARVIRSFLFGLSPFDPVAYLAVAGVMALAGVFATVYPARKATRIDPVAALRCE